jgi:hypothetical protein
LLGGIDDVSKKSDRAERQLADVEIVRKMTMTDPMDKDRLETLKASELASYIPPYTRAEVQELYRQALAKGPWWKRLWYKIRDQSSGRREN